MFKTCWSRIQNLAGHVFRDKKFPAQLTIPWDPPHGKASPVKHHMTKLVVLSEPINLVTHFSGTLDSLLLLNWKEQWEMERYGSATKSVISNQADLDRIMMI